MPEELTVSSSTDEATAVEAVAAGEEARSELQFVAEELDGVSREHSNGAPPRPVRTLTYEHPQSSRQRVLEALAEAENDLTQFSAERVTTNEPSGEDVAAEQEPDTDVDIAEVRKAATADAIAAARRQQQERDDYYRAQANQHLSSPQAELQALRAELLPSFQAKVKALLADTDVKQLEEASRIQLPEQVLDSLLSLPGGSEATAFLLKNAAEVGKLSALPPAMGIVHAVALANRFNPAAQRRASSAPQPIRPIGGSATAVAVALDEADYQTFKRAREKEIKARRR